MAEWFHNLIGDNPIVMAVVGLLLLLFWVIVLGAFLKVALRLLHIVLMFFLPFRIDDDL
jgi:hypothetical protein